MRLVDFKLIRLCFDRFGQLTLRMRAFMMMDFKSFMLRIVVEQTFVLLRIYVPQSFVAKSTKQIKWGISSIPTTYVFIQRYIGGWTPILISNQCQIHMEPNLLITGNLVHEEPQGSPETTQNNAVEMCSNETGYKCRQVVNQLLLLGLALAICPCNFDGMRIVLSSS